MTPAEYIAAVQPYFELIQAKAIALGGTRPVPYANLVLAHELLIASTPQDVLLKQVDQFAAIGVVQVDIQMGQFPWRSPQNAAAIAKYDAVIARIRSHGMRLGINPQYSSTYFTVANIGEWLLAIGPVMQTVTARYSPETLIVVHEPTTMDARMGTSSTPAQWASFATLTSAAVKGIDPTTKTGAGGLNTESTYIDAFILVAGLDIITFDIYTLAALPTIITLNTSAQGAGKETRIEETWRPPCIHTPGTPEEEVVQNVGNDELAAMDKLWINMISSWAAPLGITAVTPFFTQTFFAYGVGQTDAFESAYLLEVHAATLAGETTTSYRATQRIKSGLALNPLTAFSQANPETTLVDGFVARESVNQTFAAIRSGAGTLASDSATGGVAAGYAASATVNQFATVARGVILLNMAPLGNVSVKRASIWIYVTAVLQQLSTTETLQIVQVAPATNTGLVTADYGTFSTTVFGSVSVNALIVNAYNPIPLNAAGLAYLKTVRFGIAKLGFRLGNDVTGTFTGVWGSGLANAVDITFTDSLTALVDPLGIVWYEPISGVKNMTLRRFGR